MADESNREKVRAEEVEGLRELITQVLREVRMFFVLLVVMIILNGDKVIQFLNLLIP